MMNKKTLKKITGIFSSLNPETEEEFYENLFIKNESWNKPIPNMDESKRWEIIKNFIKRIDFKNNIRILDLGCGRGWLSNLLSSYGQVLGIEPVEKVVNHAKNLFPNIEFVVGKASSLISEYSAKFDLVVSSEVIEHIHDNEKENFVKEASLLLKSKGYLIISTPRKEAQKEWIKHNNPNQPIEEWISEKELIKLFERGGFEIIEIKRIARKAKNHPEFIDLYQVCLFRKLG